MDEKYLARCQKKLKDMGAPLSGWYCVGVIDVKENDNDAPMAVCELCGCSAVRYLHEMQHDDFYETITVGCECAAVMEGDEIAARKRERLIRNRAKRRETFLRKPWRQLSNGSMFLRYKGMQMFINPSRYNRNVLNVHVNGRTVYRYKNRPITSRLAAMYAAFDLADPLEDCYV